jgi:hypothetical protein
MLVELRIQNTLSQRLLQFVKQTVLGKDLLGIASRKQLVQRTLLDRYSSPPPASLWPCYRLEELHELKEACARKSSTTSPLISPKKEPRRVLAAPPSF